MADSRPTYRHPTLIVGIGAVGERLAPLRQLLARLPADRGMVFLLVQEAGPAPDCELAEVLAGCTAMPLLHAEPGARLEPDHVYVLAPSSGLAVRDGQLQPASLTRPVLRPIDHLFRSLAQDQGARAAAIMLTGEGDDGDVGLREVNAAGGLTMVQRSDGGTPSTTQQSAFVSGSIDLVLEIAAMPDALCRFARFPPNALDLPKAAQTEDETLDSPGNGLMGRLAEVLDDHMSFDLRVYKSRSVERRVLRRMSLSGFDDVEAYIEHLKSDRTEQQTLVRNLLIRVTEFFRDADAFTALRELVVGPLVAQADAGATLRVWVPACATGEEAYSLGIEFLDAMAVHGKRVSVQIFATDVDQDALAFGRAGTYPSSIAERVSPQRLQTYFEAVGGKGYRVRPQLRALISFAAHDLTKDAPFSRMHLVSCRNVLIYLTAEAQRHVLEALHFALVPEGHLFLSPSESTGLQRDSFASVSKGYRIYRKVGISAPSSGARSRNRRLEALAATPAPPTAAGGRMPGGTDLARRAMLQAMVPPSVVVSEAGHVIFSHGELSDFLRIPEGDNPRLEVIPMLRPNIATRTRGALYKCRRTRAVVSALSSPDGTSHRVQITARPAPLLGDEAVILSFEHVAGDVALTPLETPESFSQDAVIKQLERELHATREDLLNTVEELEASNDQLRSSSEYSMSMNDELQSANEELEATTEELRSLNEELTTVNAQLREKVGQVEQARDDLGNFFSSTKVATIFLDERLRIKRFTPAARELLGIENTDTGRLISDIARELLQNDLEREAKQVLEHLTPKSRELLTTRGRWIERHVLPYRTESRRIEGVVVTFSDVTELRQAVLELNTRSRRLELAWEAARGGIFEHRVPLDDTTYISDQWAQVLGYRRDELPPYEQLLSWLAERAHPDDRERFEQAYADVAEGRRDRYTIELRFRHHGGHWIWVRKIARALERDETGGARHLLRMMIDITDLKQVEASLRESELRFREMADGLPLMVWVHGASGEQELVNQTFCEFFAVAREDMKGGRWQMLLHPEDAESYTREFYTCLKEQRPFYAAARAQHADGSWRWIESHGRPRRSATGDFRGMVGTSADITERRRTEEALRENEERFRTLADNVSQLAWMAHGDGSVFWYNRRWYEYTGSSIESMKDWGWRAVHHPDHLDRVVLRFRRSIEQGEHWEDTFPLRGTDGEYRWFLSRAIPIRDAEGNVVRWFGTNTDVTQLREIEQKLVQADQQKDEFLAMLGHELRNPLAAIRAASLVLKNLTGGDEHLERCQQILERQTTHMAKLLDGLLDISRIIRGKIKLEREPLDFGAICREASADLVDVLKQRQLEVRCDVPEEPVCVEADRVRLTQVVSNLLANAVKYTPDGGLVHVTLEEQDGMALLRVRDTGIGIESELLPHVFDVFRQSEQSIDRSQGGLGLGLALVKKLTELHGGHAEARSEGKNRGAEFVVKLPLSPTSPARAHDSRRPPGAALHVLLIEDNEDAADMLCQLLRLSGHEVTMARTGREAMTRARESTPDVVLCDLGLPEDMSGFDVARALRADERTRGARLIALSGYGRAEDKKRSAEAGFDVHLTKPVDIKALQRILSEPFTAGAAELELGKS